MYPVLIKLIIQFLTSHMIIKLVCNPVNNVSSSLHIMAVLT